MSSSVSTPERIGRFQILSMLGRGAMGVVYLAHDEEIDRLVAIKLIRADLLDTEERESYLGRFRNEAKIAGRCIHANIVGLYDYAMHEGNPYLVMEYVDGVGLQQVYPRGSKRPVEEVLGIALQVLDALHYAHGRGIVHRDIKPANIVMMSNGTLKITDFGISRLTSMELTATPLLIGTPSYMSPEQCIGSALDGRNDLFSLGCVLYELVAGERPFTGLNYTETLFSIVNRPHTPLSRLRDDLPPGFSDAIDRALAKNPDDRFADAGAFARTLDEGARGGRATRPIVASSGPATAATVRGPAESVNPQPLRGAPVPEPEPASPPPGDVSVTRAMAEDGNDREPDRRVQDDATVLRGGADDPATDRPGPGPEIEPPLTPNPGPAPEAIPAGDRPAGTVERAHLSRCLTEIIGPIAPLLLRRVDRDGMSTDLLTRRLADHVRHADERAAFLALATSTDPVVNGKRG